VSENRIGFKDKIGYAFGDVGSSLIFGLGSTFSMVYYTDVLGLPTAALSIMFLVLKIVDGAIDPFLGMFFDSRRPTKSGKFKKYLVIFAVPVALSAVLMFFPFSYFGINLSGKQAITFASVTYLLYVVTYSSVNVPYGSLASVITDDQKGRTSLSTFRSLGSGLGGLPSALILPMLVYSSVKSVDKVTGESITVQVIKPDMLFWCVIAMSVACVVFLFLSYKMTTERIRLDETQEKTDIAKTLKSLIKSKPFISISLASLVLIMYQTFNVSFLQYLGKDYFGNKAFITLSSLCFYAPFVLLLPFLSKLIERYGKKEVCSAGLFIAAFAHLLLFILQTKNHILYLALLFVAGTGATIIILQVWALVADVIDYQELIRGKREEATTFSIYFFIRTFGNALSLFFANRFLGLVGYQEAVNGISQIQTEATVKGIYNIAALFPAACCLIMALLLAFLYPLNKKEANSLKEKLKVSRIERGITVSET